MTYIAILVTPESAGLDIARDLAEHVGSAIESGDGRFIVEGKGGRALGGWIAISKSQDTRYDFSAKDIKVIQTLISNPQFYLVEISSEAGGISDDFIMAIDDSIGAMIYNNHDNLFRKLTEVKGIIKKGIDWRFYRDRS